MVRVLHKNSIESFPIKPEEAYRVRNSDSRETILEEKLNYQCRAERKLKRVRAWHGVLKIPSWSCTIEYFPAVLFSANSRNIVDNPVRLMLVEIMLLSGRLSDSKCGFPCNDCHPPQYLSHCTQPLSLSLHSSLWSTGKFSAVQKQTAEKQWVYVPGSCVYGHWIVCTTTPETKIITNLETLSKRSALKKLIIKLFNSGNIITVDGKHCVDN